MEQLDKMRFVLGVHLGVRTNLLVDLLEKEGVGGVHGRESVFSINAISASPIVPSLCPDW